MLIILKLYPSGSDGALLILLPGLVLAVILGRAMIETLTRVTGLSFFLSGFGLLVFYGGITVSSILIAPAYAIWNLIRYVAARRG